MTRQKIEIKKIDNVAARQVTFSKRRKGLFKKAQELSTLCDADIALIVFSASGKLFDYSSSSMQELLDRHHNYIHPDNLVHKSNQSSLEFQLESNDDHVKMKEEVAKKTFELRQIKGEELQGLGLEELKKLEKSLETGLSRVVAMKDQRFLKEISTIKKKEELLREENQRLKQLTISMPKDQQQQSKKQCHSSESEGFNSISSAHPSHDYDHCFDISLKLGLSFPD